MKTTVVKIQYGYIYLSESYTKPTHFHILRSSPLDDFKTEWLNNSRQSWDPYGDKNLETSLKTSAWEYCPLLFNSVEETLLHMLKNPLVMDVLKKEALEVLI